MLGARMRPHILEEKVRRVSLGLAVQPLVSLRVVNLRVAIWENWSTAEMSVKTLKTSRNCQEFQVVSICPVSHLQNEHLFETTSMCPSADNFKVPTTR